MEDYLTHMSGNAWGGQPEILAVEAIYRVAVCVLSTTKNGPVERLKIDGRSVVVVNEDITLYPRIVTVSSRFDRETFEPRLQTRRISL